MDEAVSRLRAERLEPLIVLHSSPEWANGHENIEHVPPGRGTDFWQWRWHYGEFVHKLVLRYKGRVKYWEIGNEPNIKAFWHPAPDIWQFCTWAEYMYDQIKRADPNAVVAFAGLTHLSSASGEDISGKDFLEGMLSFDGGALRSKMDIVGVHPYHFDYRENPGLPPTEGKNRFRDVEVIHRIVPDRRIWITEYGWFPGHQGSDGLVMTETLQQEYLEEAIAVIESWDHVDMSIYFSDDSLLGRPASDTFSASVGR